MVVSVYLTLKKNQSIMNIWQNLPLQLQGNGLTASKVRWATHVTQPQTQRTGTLWQLQNFFHESKVILKTVSKDEHLKNSVGEDCFRGPLVER
jgi:hypothetical protein